MSKGGGGDHQVHRAPSPGFATCIVDRDIDPTVRPRTTRIERKAFEFRLDVLKRQLKPGSSQLVLSSMRPGSELGQGEGGNGDLRRDSRRIERSKVDRDRRIDQTPVVTQPSSEA